MLLTAKFAGILIMIWFYLTGKKAEEQGIKWAIIGVVGYWLTWWLADLLILDALVGTVKGGSAFLVTQIPVLISIVVSFFIRKKLLAEAEKNE